MRKLFFILIFLISNLLVNGQESIQLRWNPSTDNVAVTGYNVWMDAEYYGTTSDTSFIFTNMEVGMYLLAVSAFDAAGNESALSETLMVDIADITPPTVPDSLLVVFPNPTFNGAFTVQYSEPLTKPSILQVLTTTGKLVYHKKVPPTDGYLYEEYFDLSALLTEGMYVIALIEGDKRIGHAYLSVPVVNNYSFVRGYQSYEFAYNF